MRVELEGDARGGEDGGEGGGEGGGGGGDGGGEGGGGGGAGGEHGAAGEGEALALSEDDQAWLEENDLSGDLALECDGAPSFNLMAALRLRHATPAEREAGAGSSNPSPSPHPHPKPSQNPNQSQTQAGAGFSILEGEQASAPNEALAWRDVRAIAIARLAALEAVPTPQGEGEVGIEGAEGDQGAGGAREGAQDARGAQGATLPLSARLAEMWRESQARVLRATLARAAGAAQLREEARLEAQGTKRRRA